MKRMQSVFLVYLIVFSLFGNFVSAEDAPATGAATDSESDTFTLPDATQPDPRTLIETPEETAEREAGNPVVTATEPVEQVDGYLCKASDLSPEESLNLIDVLKNGFTGEELAGLNPGQDAKDNREELASNELVLINPNDENAAVKTEIPNKKFSPFEISQFLNTSVKGPFAFGVVLEDSLRTGRCETYSSEDCTLTGPNLKYRNSGAGILADLKPVKEAFTEIPYTEWLTGEKNLTQFSAEENDVLRAALVTEGDEEPQAKIVSRLEQELIPNSILTDVFEARLQTNCNNPSCVISIYSLFDKYFNSWMSSEMVVSTFGPSLLYQTKKLFGWTSRRGFLSGAREGYYDFLDRFRKRYVNAESFLGKLRTNRIKNILDKNNWRSWYQDMVGGHPDGSGYYIFQTEGFQHWWGKQQGAGGFLEKIKTAEERSDFIKLVKDMRSVQRAAKARTDEAELAWKLARDNPALGLNNPVTVQKKVDYGREIVSWMDETYDEMMGADYIEWITHHPNTGFYNKGVLQIRSDGSSEVIDLFQEHRNLQRILKKFKNDGTFKGFEETAEYGSRYQTNGDNLVLYAFDRDTAQNYRGLSYSNLDRAATGIRDTFAATDHGDIIRYSKQSVPFIQKRMGANAQLFEGSWKEAGELTPSGLVDRLTNGRTGPSGNMKFGVLNTQQMLDTVREKNWVSRRYWNSLDKLLAQEDELVRSYFTIKGGAKWTALPYGYWWAKKGFGIEGVSQYQLPQEWHDLKFTHGFENVYDYAYVDFFANEGSDQGDLFVQMIEKLPWKLILDEVSDKYNPVKNLYDSLTKNELRNETEGLAFYLTGPDSCIGCTVVIKSEGLSDFRPFFFVEDKEVVSYILEDTKSDTAKEKGQTLIAFAGHTNLEGKSGDEKGELIDLIEAISNDDVKTCKQAVEELNFQGVPIGQFIPEKFAEKGRVGAVLAGLESVTYGTFFWAGIFSTVAIQIVIAPQLHGCVDVDEGYYAHYFVPAKKEEDKTKGTTELSTEKVSDLVQNFKETFVDSYEGDQNTLTKQAVGDLGDELDKFVNDAKDNDIVQATLKFNGVSSGQLDSRTLFYFWCGEGCELNPSSYKEEGNTEIRGTNDVNLNIDYEKGQITADGVPIVQNPDNVRLSATDLSIPAIEIPKRVTETCLEQTTDVALEINAAGEVTILNQDLLKCIQDGVLHQTGLPMTTNKLNDVFGKLDAIVTSTHPNVRPLGDRIVAEGVPRKVADGKTAKVFVSANREVSLSSSNDDANSLGELQSLQFANGVIVVKPNGCYLTWLKHHADGILSKDDVEGIKSKLNRELDEKTQCEAPAIDFDIIPDFGSDFKVSKVDKFNTALDYQGPFSVFETPTKRYVISAERDENGDCKDHLRVVDKDTGDVTDYVGDISQTPDGLKITTGDGQEHDISFTTKDGAPFVQFDDEKPELLTAAQGKNGSFYYDPENGLWFAENAQLLPLIEAFREGIAAKVQPNGEVTANASGNSLTLNLGDKEDSGFLNLPSLPEQRYLIALMFIAMMVSFAYVQRKRKIIVQ